MSDLKNAPFVEAMDLGDWHTKFNGMYIEVQVDFLSPIVKQIFKRNFIQSQRELYYLFVLLPFSIGAEDVSKVQGLIDNTILKHTKSIADEIHRLNASLSGIELSATNTATRISRVSAPIATPQAKSVLELYQKADFLHRILVTAWISGYVTNDERQGVEERIKKALRAVINTVKTVCRQTTAKARKNAESMDADTRQQLAEAVEVAEVRTDEDESESYSAIVHKEGMVTPAPETEITTA